MAKHYTFSLLLALIFSLPSAIAKTGTFFPGYIITKSGKKLVGEIKECSIIEREIKVQFLPKGKNSSKRYSAKDINGYGIELPELNDAGNYVKNWLHYESFSVENPPKIFGPKQVFIERKIEGNLSLYRYIYEYRADIEDPYKIIFYVKDDQGKCQMVDEDNFESFSRKTFEAYSALAKRVGKEKFRYHNFLRMINDYNFWLDNQHDKNLYRVANIK